MMTADSPNPTRGSGAESACNEDAAMLQELAQIGMRLARLVEANAEAKVAEDPAGDLGRVDQAFARISRSIRQTLALKTKLAELAAQRGRAEAPEADAARLHWRKAKLARAVTETIKAEFCARDAEYLLTDLHERLEDPDIALDLACCSMGEMVASVCDDLGIGISREVWERKGWYLTENWRLREKAEPSAPPPARSLAEITAEAIAMMNETTHGPPPVADDG